MAGPATLYQAGTHAARPASGAGCVLYSCTDHDLVYRDSGTAWTTFMTLVGGSGGDIATDTIWDAKGDVVGGTGANTAARLAAGTNGMALLADSSTATGLAWGNPIKFARSNGSDVSATAFADTDLVFAVAASSTYVFEFHLYFYTNATTVGLRLAINGPAGATGRFGAYVPSSAASGTSTTVAIAQRADLDQPIVSTTTGPGVSPVYAKVSGSMIISATPGNVTLRHASETATQTVIEAGSWGWCAKVV